MKATRGTIAATFFAIALATAAATAQQATTPAPATSPAATSNHHNINATIFAVEPACHPTLGGCECARNFFAGRDLDLLQGEGKSG